jgi:hypothetical protein
MRVLNLICGIGVISFACYQAGIYQFYIHATVSIFWYKLLAIFSLPLYLLGMAVVIKWYCARVVKRNIVPLPDTSMEK